MGDSIEKMLSSNAIPQDTICAIATPIGESGIGMTRMSGPDAIAAAARVFRSPSGISLAEVPSHTVHFGRIVDPQSHATVDEVLLTVMRAPRTYTREDMVEITCHGGPLPLRRILELLLASGARLAEPGEFTKRAFLSGRIDLTQAEAVMDIIRSKTDLGLDVALRQLAGHLGKKIRAMKERLIHLLAGIEASIDFSEEGFEFASAEQMTTTVVEVADEMESLIATAGEGRILKEGITVAIVGRPNVGKSSLLNALLRDDRAIVTPIPGTTRDSLEEFVNIGGIPIRLIDTAGIRETEDPVEVEGVRRTRRAVERAALLLLVIDQSEALTEDDRILVSDLLEKPRILVLAKTDLPAAWRAGDEETFAKEGWCEISSRTGKGLDGLRQIITRQVFSDRIATPERTLITSVRQREACRHAGESLQFTLKSLTSGAPPEIVAADLRAAIHHLGCITGETTTEDLLDALFNDFCIGK